MRSIAVCVIILHVFAFAEQDDADDLVINLIAKLFDSPRTVSVMHDADRDGTTLGKMGSLAISQRASTPHLFATASSRWARTISEGVNPSFHQPHPISRTSHMIQKQKVAVPRSTSNLLMQEAMQESAQVEERIVSISSEKEFNEKVAAVGDHLVVLEVDSDLLCETGLDEETEAAEIAQRTAGGFMNIKGARVDPMDACVRLKHSFQRCARDCQDALFLNLNVDESNDALALSKKLGVETFPSLLFFKGGQKVWEHKGAIEATGDLAAGVLYYEGVGKTGKRASAYITTVKSMSDIDYFVKSQPKDTLAVVDMSLSTGSGCVRIYPTVCSLAQTFKGTVSFARLLGDESPEAEAAMKEMNIQAAPTFLFYRNGELVDRHVGSGPASFIAELLSLQQKAGIPVPPPQR